MNNDTIEKLNKIRDDMADKHCKGYGPESIRTTWALYDYVHGFNAAVEQLMPALKALEEIMETNGHVNVCKSDADLIDCGAGCETHLLAKSALREVKGG